MIKFRTYETTEKRKERKNEYTIWGAGKRAFAKNINRAIEILHEFKKRNYPQSFIMKNSEHITEFFN